MKNEDKQKYEVKSRKKIYNFLMFGIPCILAFYIFSFGPVFWLYRVNGWELSSFWIIYAPISWLHDHTFMGKPLNWYLNLYNN